MCSHLRELSDQTLSCIRNLDNAVIALDNVGEVDENMHVFTADTVAIHLKIDEEEGLVFIALAPNTGMHNAKPSWLRKEIMLVIKLLLKFNVFQFGDIFYREKEGGAMGSPFAYS